jgi:hypothetical protein
VVGTVRKYSDPLLELRAREDGWPTVESCLAFAKLYAVPGAELAAFFGFVGVRHGSRTIWVDALRGLVPSYTARQQATRAQAVALGFTQMVAEVPRAGRARATSSRSWTRRRRAFLPKRDRGPRVAWGRTAPLPARSCTMPSSRRSAC